MKIILWVLGIVLGIGALLTGGFFAFNAYIYHEKQAPEPTEEELATAQQDTERYVISRQQTLRTTADLSATIDANVTASPLPVLSGTVTSGKQISASLLGMEVYQKGPPRIGYYSGNVTVSGNRWSATLGSELPAGNYIVEMYILDGHSDFGSNNVITTATLTVGGERVTLSRPELFARELELVKEFGLDDALGTASLYRLRDESQPVEFSPLNERGLSMLIPHERGYGFPYYELTPFDVVEDQVWYGTMNPCPAGCPELGSKGILRGKITFHPAGSSERIVKEYETHNGQYGGYCREVAINEHTTGMYCFDEESFIAVPKILIEGTNYTYEIRDQKCRLYEELEIEECKTMAESIKVQ